MFWPKSTLTPLSKNALSCWWNNLKFIITSNSLLLSCYQKELRNDYKYYDKTWNSLSAVNHYQLNFTLNWNKLKFLIGIHWISREIRDQFHHITWNLLSFKIHNLNRNITWNQLSISLNYLKFTIFIVLSLGIHYQFH